MPILKFLFAYYVVCHYIGNRFWNKSILQVCWYEKDTAFCLYWFEEVFETSALINMQQKMINNRNTKYVDYLKYGFKWKCKLQKSRYRKNEIVST